MTDNPQQSSAVWLWPELEQWQCIVVEWIDSCGSGGWHQVEDHHTEAIHCVTCGLLYGQNSDALTVVLSRDVDNGNVSGLITIPKLAVTGLHHAMSESTPGDDGPCSIRFKW